MFSQIIDSIKTKDDLLTLHAEISLVKDGLYSKDSTDEVLYKNLRKSIADLIKDEIAKSDDKKSEIEALLARLETYEIISITYPHEPTQEDVDYVYGELAEEIKEAFVIDLAVNPEIIAGIVIHYKGEYRDYSLKKKLESQLKEVSQKINMADSVTVAAENSQAAKQNQIASSGNQVQRVERTGTNGVPATSNTK